MRKTLTLAATLTLLCGVSQLRRVAADSAVKSLRQTELLALVAGNALPENVVREIGADGMAFRPDDAYRSLLGNAGADATILKALDSAKIVISDGVEDRADNTILQHLSDAGKLIKDKHDEESAAELTAALKADFQSPESGFVMGEVLRQEERWGDAARAIPRCCARRLIFPKRTQS
jgi:hypothetical protein